MSKKYSPSTVPTSNTTEASVDAAVGRLLTVPNMLTGYRFVAAPLVVVLLMIEQNAAVGLTAFAVFLSAALTDLADGYYARKYQIESVLGKLMDPLADKVLVMAPLIMLIPLNRLPAWLSFFLICREIIITGLRSLAAASGIVVAAGRQGKIKSIFLYTGLCILIFPENLLPFAWLHPLGQLTIYAALVLSVWSGWGYFFNLKKIYLDF